MMQIAAPHPDATIERSWSTFLSRWLDSTGQFQKGRNRNGEDRTKRRVDEGEKIPTAIAFVSGFLFFFYQYESSYIPPTNEG